MKEVTIQSVGEYINLFGSFEDTEFYRGVADASYKLIPSVGRYNIDDLKRLVQFEKEMLDSFKIKSSSYLTTPPKNDLEWLFLAQHHGIPTRLMDWSFNPLVALFFAVENLVEADAAVYCAWPSSGLTPNSLLKQPDGVFNTAHQATHIVPNRDHIRYQNQDGLFTIHPDPRQNEINNITRKVIIPFHFKDSMKWKLRKMGISKSYIYGNLDGLCYDILEVSKRKLNID